jgi:alkylation response protein AidB-like acyl-CoA dehydrogenase
LKIGHIENKLGLHGSSTGQLYFNNCRIPKENVLASFDINFTEMMAGGYEIAVLIGVGCLGGAEGVFEKTLRFCREKKHGDQSLYDSYQVLRHQLAELWIEIEAYRSFVYSVMDEMDRGESVAAQAWACKVKGSQLFERVASQCVMLNGGNGVVVENDIERYYRDAKTTSVAGFALPHITDIITTLI